MHVVDANSALQTTVDGLPVSRRMLQATAVAQAGKNIVATEPASEISQLATSPSPEQEQEDLSSLLDALNSAPSPETDFSQITSVPSLETLAPAEEAFLPPPKNFSSETAIQECTCPPGPKGDSAPEFLNNIFSFDQTRGILKIDATTIELSGNLVIDGFAGVKQSLFIGGDPSNGSPSTEVAAGKLLVYGGADEGPTIAAFSTGPDGFALSDLTIKGELYEDAKGLGQPKRVSTGLF